MVGDSPWAGVKVLVTGARGFIGSHLCRRLCEAGSIVHATSRSKMAVGVDGPRWWQGDLADVQTARSLIAEIKPEVIFHLSGAVGASPNIDLVLPTFLSLLTSTVNVLTLGTESGCRRVVLVASLTEPERGESEPTPGSPYAAAKWASGAYGRMFHRLYDTPCVTVRPFMVYGPGQNPEKLIPAVTNSFLRGEAARLSSGQWKADWVYIDDIVEGFLQAAITPKIEEATIDLGSGTLVSVREVVERLCAVIGGKGKPLFGALPDRPFEQVRVADTVATYSRIGWKAVTPLESGLCRTVEWYRNRWLSQQLPKRSSLSTSSFRK